MKVEQVTEQLIIKQRTLYYHIIVFYFIVKKTSLASCININITQIIS